MKYSAKRYTAGKKDDKGSGRAIIALARRISCIVFVMLSKRETFNPDLMRITEQNVQQQPETIDVL